MCDNFRIILPTTGERLNEDDFVHYMERLKILDVSRFNPPSWLQHSETPFKWAQEVNPKTMMKHDIERKLEDYPKDDQDGCYSYEKFCLHLLNVFQSVLIEDHENSKHTLQQLKNFVEEISKHTTDIIYNRIGDALKQVLLAVVAQVSLLIGDLTEEESRNIGLSLLPFYKMDPIIKAGIEAIKAKFYLSCLDDSTIAIKYMKEANKLDPKCAAWLYWTGKITRKIRKRTKDREPREEISYFESACNMKKDPKYILFLAQAYREKALYLQFKDKSYNYESDDEQMFLERSSKLYRECWELKKDSAAINRRLGNGFKSLKKPYGDHRLAEELLIEALKLSNNPNTYHQLGSFYLKNKKDCPKAIKYFTKGAECGLLQCFNELVRLKYIFDPNYDPYEDLNKIEDVMKYSFDLPKVYSDLVWYYLSFKHDLCKAVEYCFKILERRDDSYLKKFWSYTFFVTSNVNMYSLLRKEVLDFQEKETGPENVIFQKLFDKIAENPDLVFQDNGEDSLYLIKEASSKSLNKWRETLNCKSNNLNNKQGGYKRNQFQEKNQGKPEEVANYSDSIYNNKARQRRNEQRERKTYKNRNSIPFQNQKSSPSENKISNWRLECKDS